MNNTEAEVNNSNEEPTRQSPPTQSPIGTPLTNRLRMESSKPPSGGKSEVPPKLPVALSEPFGSSKSPELLTQKLNEPPASDDTGLMQPMKSTIQNIEMPEQLKEILAPTPPSNSSPFPKEFPKPHSRVEEHNLMIDNLPIRLTEQGFQDLFAQFGDLKSVRAHLAVNADGSSRGYGFVDFRTHDEAMQAIKHYDGFVLWGQTLKASFQGHTEPQGSCLTILDFPRSWGTPEIRQCFEEFGQILEISLKHDSCLVRFLRPLDCRVAMSSRNGWVPPGHTHGIRVRIGKNPPQQPPNLFPNSISPNSETYEMPLNLFGGLYSPPRRFEHEDRHQAPQIQYQRKLHERIQPAPQPAPQPAREEPGPVLPCSEMVFLYNLPTFFQKAHVENFCSLYGQIKSVSMQKDNTGCYLGMAYVIYGNREEAKEAVQALNGCSMFKQTISATLTKS